MDEISKTLIQISNFRDLEQTLTTGKYKELQRNQQQFLVSVKPSNLVKPTSMGEKFAPDSCIQDDFLKYVWGNHLIESKQDMQVLTCNKDFLYDPIVSNTPQLLEFISPLIVYDRPKCTRSEPLEELVNKTLPIEKPTVSTKKDQLKSTLKPSISHTSKVTKKPKAPKTKPKVARTVSKKDIVSIHIPSFDSSSTLKPKLQRKQHKAPSKKSSINSSITESSIPSDLSSPKKNVRWSESALKKHKEKTQEDFKEKRTWSESVLIEKQQEKIQEDYKEKRKELFENLKLPLSTLKSEEFESVSPSKSDKSIEELEKIVKYQHEKLLREGIVSPEALSESQRFKSSYEDLDREIQNIKRMLYQKEEELKEISSRSDLTLRSSENTASGPMMVKDVYYSPESSAEPHKAVYESSSESQANESLSQLSYSSDDGDQSIDDWLSPRFPNGRNH